jgi:hypothetical protein
MQGDSGSSYSKRKAVEGSSSLWETSFRVKRTRMSSDAEPLWPDYFKEVSVRESSLKLTLGTSLLSVVQGALRVDPRITLS